MRPGTAGDRPHGEDVIHPEPDAGDVDVAVLKGHPHPPRAVFPRLLVVTLPLLGPRHHGVSPVRASLRHAEMSRRHKSVVHVRLVEAEVLPLPMVGKYSDGETPASGIAPEMVLRHVVHPLDPRVRHVHAGFCVVCAPQPGMFREQAVEAASRQVGAQSVGTRGGRSRYLLERVGEHDEPFDRLAIAGLQDKLARGGAAGRQNGNSEVDHAVPVRPPHIPPHIPRLAPVPHQTEVGFDGIVQTARHPMRNAVS